MTLSDTLYLADTKYQRVATVQPSRFVGFRCLHFREGGYPNPEGMPCVRPAYNARAVTFTKELQLMSYALNFANPNLTKNKWRVVYGDGTAFCNGSGFGARDGDVYADWVNLLNLTAELPALQKGIICGGAFLRGVIEGDYLVCTPGVHAIDGTGAVPSVEEVLAKQWCFTATTGGWERVSHFPQGGGLPVLIPFVLREVTRYPLRGEGYTNFVRWDADTLPNPLTFYNPL
jgi:hypothetical protein